MKRKHILILHGWMHSAARYERLKDALKGYETTCYEFPGFGDSPAVFKQLILDCYAKELACYLKSHETDVIIAHSMGGAVVLRALNRFLPKKKYTVILINPAYGGVPKLLPALFLLPLVWAGIWILRLLPYGVSKRIYRLLSLATINRSQDMDELICLDAKKGDPLTAALLLAEMAVDPFRTGPVKSHVFLIVSGKDRVLSRRSMKRLRQDLGGCPWVSYPQIGHTPVLEAFEHLAGDIRKIAGS